MLQIKSLVVFDGGLYPTGYLGALYFFNCKKMEKMEYFV